MVPELVVPGWRHAPQGECVEEEQGSGDTLEAWCVVLALVVLGWGGEVAPDIPDRAGVLAPLSTEPAQPYLVECSP